MSTNKLSISLEIEVLDVKAYITGTHILSFRKGEWAEILGLRIVRPGKAEARLCYKCKYKDGVIDYIAVSETSTYEITIADEEEEGVLTFQIEGSEYD